MSHLSRMLTMLLALLAIAAAAPAQADEQGIADAGPAPHLGPGDVVRRQLESLRRNDDADSGIAAAFRFASPRNQRSTGPLERFARMIRGGPYALMLRYEEASYGPVEVRGRRAAQRVTLIAPGEAPMTFVFLLSRQDADGPLDDCWMTDAVQIVPAEGTTA